MIFNCEDCINGPTGVYPSIDLLCGIAADDREKLDDAANTLRIAARSLSVRTLLIKGFAPDVWQNNRETLISELRTIRAAFCDALSSLRKRPLGDQRFVQHVQGYLDEFDAMIRSCSPLSADIAQGGSSETSGTGV